MAAGHFFHHSGARSWLLELASQKRDVGKILQLSPNVPYQGSIIQWWDTKAGWKQFFDELNELSGFRAHKGTQTDG
jgi:hypothetical protein